MVDRVVQRVRETAGDAGAGLAASFGVAVADPSQAIDSDELLRRADSAMYDAKGSRTVLRVVA